MQLDRLPDKLWAAAWRPVLNDPRQEGELNRGIHSAAGCHSSAPQLTETFRKRAVSADGVLDGDRDNGCRWSRPGRPDLAAAQAGCCAAATSGRGPGNGFAGARVTAATLSGWRDAFLAAGETSLATRPAVGEALESERLKARLGEMLLERELLEAKVAALEGGRPLVRRRSRPWA